MLLPGHDLAGGVVIHGPSPHASDDCSFGKDPCRYEPNVLLHRHLPVCPVRASWSTIVLEWNWGEGELAPKMVSPSYWQSLMVFSN